MGRINSAVDLIVYQKGYLLAMDIFHISKTWPKEEKYSLTDQVRRSSRAVCANLREAWAKRRFRAHFLSKLTDVDSENAETDTWLRFAFDCGYVKISDYRRLKSLVDEITKMIDSMLYKPDPFLLK